mgnify:CR=1 FL=1
MSTSTHSSVGGRSETPQNPIENSTRRRWLGLFGGLGAGAAAGRLLAPAASAPVLLAAALPARAELTPAESGLAGTWYEPRTSGQGFVLQTYPDLFGPGVGLLSGGWFTFDTVSGGPERQRWYTFNGELTSNGTLAEVVIYRNDAGSFDAGPQTFAAVVGTARIELSACAQATFTYELSDGRAGSISLQRGLAGLCSASAGTGASDFALSGAWYRPETSGQGLMVEVNPVDGFAFMTWYTYAPAGNGETGARQRWFTAEGRYTPGSRQLVLTLYVSTGGVFDTPSTVGTLAVGQAELVWTSCESATLSYRFSSGEFAGTSGAIALTRITEAPQSCTFGTSCALIPTETDGPYPLYTVLQTPGVVRQDITGGKTGVPLTLVLRLVNINNSCAPIEEAAVYIWHCDKDGAYSGYSQPGANAIGETFCRGVQYSDANGQALFRSIYPGWYAGRITHIHFQIYLRGLGTTVTATSQVAFPQAITQAVYASPLYAARGQNTSVPSFAQDNVFSDGTSLQMVEIVGSASVGYTATLTVGVRG